MGPKSRQNFDEFADGFACRRGYAGGQAAVLTMAHYAPRSMTFAAPPRPDWRRQWLAAFRRVFCLQLT